MKLKIKIVGHKVHDVGYRVFLGKLAMALALPGFTAYNWMEEENHQEVVVLIEGDPARIAAFRAQVEGRRPELADVSTITFEGYEGDVGRTSEFAMFLSFEQLDKAVPLLLDMRDDLKAVRKTTDTTLEEIKAVRKNTDMIPQIADEIKAVRKNTDTIPQISGDIKAVRKTGEATLDEIKGLRDDIQPGFAMQFRQMQVDVRAIKERLGMS